MASIFTEIINRQRTAYIIAEDKQFISFLDIHPLTQGHTLVVPKLEVDYIFDLEKELLKEILLFAQHVAKGIQQAIPCLRVGMAVVGLDVPHAHIHLIPLHSAQDIDFKKNTLSFTPEELLHTAKAIKQYITF